MLYKNCASIVSRAYQEIIGHFTNFYACTVACLNIHIHIRVENWASSICKVQCSRSPIYDRPTLNVVSHCCIIYHDHYHNNLIGHNVDHLWFGQSLWVLGGSMTGDSLYFELCIKVACIWGSIACDCKSWNELQNRTVMSVTACTREYIFYQSSQHQDHQVM